MSAGPDPARDADAVLHAMETCRAMRYLEPRPVPEPLIRKVIHAATRASSPGNSQGWEFVVLREREGKAKIGAALRDVMRPVIRGMTGGGREVDPVEKRMFAGVTHLLDHFESVPVFVFVCGRLVYPPQSPQREMLSASVYPAAQNAIVAARALGLGTTFTTFHALVEPVVRQVLALPDEVLLGVMIAMGWPARPFGPVARKPLDDVLHWERW